MWAYHTTDAIWLDVIRHNGLRPSDRSVTRRGELLLFFADTAAGAFRYFIDREDPWLLRFPWPANAVSDYGGEFTSSDAVAADLIEVYDGKLLDGLVDAYHLDFEDRFDVLGRFVGRSKRVERARAWAPLLR